MWPAGLQLDHADLDYLSHHICLGNEYLDTSKMFIFSQRRRSASTPSVKWLAKAWTASVSSSYGTHSAAFAAGSSWLWDSEARLTADHSPPFKAIVYSELIFTFALLLSGYGLDDRTIDVRSPAEARDFLSVPRPALEATQPPVQWASEVLSLGVIVIIKVTLPRSVTLPLTPI
jgi:hypothetical protein